MLSEVPLGHLAGVPGDAMRDGERRVLLSEARPDARRAYRSQGTEARSSLQYSTHRANQYKRDRVGEYRERFSEEAPRLKHGHHFTSSPSPCAVRQLLHPIPPPPPTPHLYVATRSHGRRSRGQLVAAAPSLARATRGVPRAVHLTAQSAPPQLAASAPSVAAAPRRPVPPRPSRPFAPAPSPFRHRFSATRTSPRRELQASPTCRRGVATGPRGRQVVVVNPRRHRDIATSRGVAVSSRSRWGAVVGPSAGHGPGRRSHPLGTWAVHPGPGTGHWGQASGHGSGPSTGHLGTGKRARPGTSDRALGPGKQARLGTFDRARCRFVESSGLIPTKSQDDGILIEYELATASRSRYFFGAPGEFQGRLTTVTDPEIPWVKLIRYDATPG
ncbi:hypothetical protein NL676_038871 [Syzygium grande]|nr:hypothetical protein NL676_038871 [Syzygium grande]